MLKSSLKWISVWAVALAILGGVFLGATSVRIPVPAKEQQECFDIAKKHGERQPKCPPDKTLLQAGLSDPIAYYTLWLVLFTGLLAEVGIIQGFLIFQQARLARDEFNATHRPKIRARSFGFDETNTCAKTFGLSFTCTNVGDGDGEILLVKYALCPASKPWPVRKKDTRFFPTTIVHPCTIDVGEPVRIDTGAITEVPYESLGFEWDFFGYVLYTNGKGRKWLTGFWRRFDVQSDSFSAPENPDFNYED